MDLTEGLSSQRWVIVILDNDVQIAGIWWTNSFASSISNERDIYLEEVYSVLEDGSWEKVSRTDGMYIKGEKIRLIQFWNDEIKEE